MNNNQHDAAVAFVIAAPDGQSTIMCRVTQAALEHLAKSHGSDASDLRVLSARFQPQLQHAAIELYKSGQIETDGSVVVDDGDVFR